MTDTLTILDRLVSFETINANPNVAMIDYIETFCKDLGAQCDRIPSALDDKVGLVARLGPQAPGGIVLSGHCDVVPVTGQYWHRPSFQLTREGDRLFGRGTTDMKGFLSCMLEAAQLASKQDLTKPLTLVFSYDEEIGCVGIQEMKDALRPLLGDPRLCIVGEPTSMQIAIGHKGKAALRAKITGQSGHSALAPHFVNAIHIATDFIAELRALQDWYAQNGARDAAYDVPFSTLHVGKLHAGTALNIIPDAAEITFEYRHLFLDREDQLFERILQSAAKIAALYQDRFAEANIQIERYNTYPGLEVDQGGDATTFAQELARTKGTTKVAFGTEAGVFTQMGIPAIVCGPGSMSGQGHKPDEFIELAQLQACSAMLDRVVHALR
ncbi:MAG: acetylornithine deacetylase [Pseudomonadota bacterium]